MLQCRVISEAFFTFIFIREFIVLCQSSVLFKFNGFIRLYFGFGYISSELSLFPELFT